MNQGDISNPIRKEIHWTDAQIRWTAANHNLNDDADVVEEEDEEDSKSSEFQPQPTQLFSYRFVPKDPFLLSCTHGNESETAIDIDLKGYEEESDTIYVSTGLTLWRSSQLLSDYMLGSKGILHHFNEYCKSRKKKNQDAPFQLLELGSGLGLNGILAYRLLQRHAELTRRQKTEVESAFDDNFEPPVVVLTDGDTNALALLRQNVQSNEHSLRDGDNEDVHISVQQLLWGKQHAKDLKAHRPSSLETNKHKFNIILASDAIYVKENVQPLLETVQELLKRDGEFWFSYCCRRQVSVSIDDVLSAATAIGLHPELVGDDEDNDLVAYAFRWKK